MVIGGAITGAQYLSYRRKESGNRLLTGAGFTLLGGVTGGLLKGSATGVIAGAITGAVLGVAPAFDKGIFEGFSGMWAKTNIAGAKLSNRLGLTQSRKEQEEFLPGITNFKTMVGFMGRGAVVGGMLGYGLKTVNRFRTGTAKFDEVLQVAQDAISSRAVATQATRLGLKGKVLGELGDFIGQGSKTMADRIMTRGGRIGIGVGLAAYGAMAISAALLTGHVIPGVLGAKHTPDELENIYAGKELVPVRSGRWWETSRTAWEGGRIQYYRPHWYPLMMSGAKDAGLWGSEQEKWESSKLLHPFKALFSDEFKYRFEREHYYDRPYPISSTYGTDVPFISAFAEQIGKLVKPPKLMHTDEWLFQDERNASGDTGVVLHLPEGRDTAPARELGGLPPALPVSPYSVDQQAGDLIYKLNELRGLTGFVHNAVKGELTGSQNYFSNSEQLESSYRAYGLERNYWDRELGGIAGMSESLRRFIPHRRREIPLYNPIKNQMPSWLPGADYFSNFTIGDPFTRVPMGDIRLPGQGYSALNPEVAGLSPEEYPLFHRYKILADVAMYSNEFKQTRREVQTAIKRKELSLDQVSAIQEINRQVSEKKKRKVFSNYKYTEDTLEKSHVTIQKDIGPGLWATDTGGVIGLGGIEIRADKDTKGYRNKQAQVSDFLREYVHPGMELDIFTHRDELHTYKKSGGQFYQPAVIVSQGTNVGQELVKQGMAEYAPSDALGVQTKYGPVKRGVGSLFERIMHKESPLELLIPFSPKGKFIHQRTPVEEFESSRVFGSELGLWQHPISQFVEPSLRMMKRSWLGKSDIPSITESRYAIEDYFDKLKYFKLDVLSKSAADIGDIDQAKKYKDEQKRTLFGANPFGSPGNVMRALPTLDRDYYQSFVQTESPEDRERILKDLAPNQRKVYEAQWLMQKVTAAKARLSMGTPKDSDEATVHTANLLRMTEGQPVDRELLQQYEKQRQGEESYAEWSRGKSLNEYFSKEAPLPGPDYVGFHPQCDLEDVKLQVIKNVGLDMHNFNLWESRERLLPRKPYINQAQPLGEPSNQNPGEVARLLEINMRNVLKMDQVQVSVAPSNGVSSTDITINDDRQDALQAYKHDPSFNQMV